MEVAPRRVEPHDISASAEAVAVAAELVYRKRAKKFEGFFVIALTIRAKADQHRSP